MIKGTKIERNRYKSDGSLDYKSSYVYDDKGIKFCGTVINRMGV